MARSEMKLKGSFGAFLRRQVRTSSGFMRGTAEGSLRGMQHSVVEATPRKTGRLQRSVKKTKARRRADGQPGWEGEVYSKLSYAWIVNQGRRKKEVHAKPGHHFHIGSKKMTHYTQSAMIGRRMFQRGAFAFSTTVAEPYMAAEYEKWVHTCKIESGQGA